MIARAIPNGEEVSVWVSLIDTQGGVQIGIQVGDQEEVILPDQTSLQLSTWLTKAYQAKAIANEQDGRKPS